MMPLPSGYALIRLESVDSTNEEAKRRAVAGAPDGTIILAAEQTHGRGRRGREWSSPVGNLYCSFLLRLDVPLETATQMGFITALALREGLAACAPAGVAVACKWPNDVLVDGRKCAGILMETAGGEDGGRPGWLVVGFGVNLISHPVDSEFPATSLSEAGFGKIRIESLLGDLIGRFDDWRCRWQQIGFVAVRHAWLEAAHGRGQAITVRLHDETFQGTFADLDRDGALLVDVAAGQRRITAGDVFFRRPLS